MNNGSVFIIMGPPGSGKGTQSQHLAKRLGIPHFSTGDLLRAIIEEGTPAGLEAKTYLDKGAFVPSNFVWKILKEKMQSIECSQGCIIDGFPRTLDQAQLLNNFLKKIQSDYTVIFLEISENEIVKRIGSRFLCPSCSRIYKKEQGYTECPDCLMPLIRRSDDTPEVIKERLKKYRERTAPVITYYEKLGKLCWISSEDKEDLVFENLLRCIYK
ncbi:Adenylate kinase,adenylate kinase,adenylate kinase,Adenylate kinase [Chlamydia serpentis]|uniref:Adenylate kinase n=1 Tax=Chlamydia serpentis TaxID=1967782 RepID=A0A2R8FAG0_9CHLA|nr:adenylate kinase [Chlamydia serpentis]SPN73395.1 Adenylate kinase,adenylate kinase,adenylate kinase,Adenylate kinase [Chlamydia serpentis]